MKKNLIVKGHGVNLGERKKVYAINYRYAFVQHRNEDGLEYDKFNTVIDLLSLWVKV